MSKSETGKHTYRIDEIHQGNPLAIEGFVRKNTAWMLSVAFRVLLDREHAEDAVQNAFIKIFNNLDTFKGHSKLETWMHRITINEALMLVRKRNRTKEHSIDELSPEFHENGCRIEEHWGVIENPEKLLQLSDTREKITQLIENLPDEYRHVILLRDIEELTTAEVAGLLGISENNVKVRLHRARAALKKLLEPLLKGGEL